MRYQGDLDTLQSGEETLKALEAKAAAAPARPTLKAADKLSAAREKAAPS
jgi:DNA repair ATPase RecN